MTVSEKRVLPADVYDALELSALAFGGIGSWTVFKDGDRACPWCVVGHAIVAADLDTNANPIIVALEAAGIDVTANDTAVDLLNGPGRYGHRVSFAKWRRKLSVARGD